MRAIILKKTLFGEASEILTVYTGELGKLRAVAGSVRSNKSKLAHGLQSLFYSELDFVKGRRMRTVTGAKPINTFKNIRGDLSKTYAAFYALEVLLKGTPDEQPNQKLFDLFLEFLEHLDSSPEKTSHGCADIFALQLLSASGYALTFERCAVCFQKIDPAKVHFSRRKTGFLCGNCCQRSSDSEMVPQSLFNIINSGIKNSYQSTDSEAFSHGLLHSFTGRLVSHILERNLNAAQYLATLK